VAHAAGLRLSGPADQDRERLREFCGARRLLLVFDNCGVPPFPRGGKCSMLLTAPHAGGEPLRAAELERLFRNWMREPEPCLAALGDVPAAIGQTAWSQVRGLAYSAVALLRHQERAAELLELVEELIPRARTAGDESAVRHFEWERSWLVQAWERTEAIAAPVLAPAPGDQLTLSFVVEAG
jgi:hypothetical protein